MNETGLNPGRGECARRAGEELAAVVRARVWVVVLAGMVVGCRVQSDRLAVYPVSGKVTVAGEVPEGALIVFYPQSPAGPQELRPSAKVNADGTFRLTTYEADDGAPAGDYTATLEWNKLVKKGADFVAGPNVVPAEYASPEKSPWKVKVSESATTLPPLEIAK